MSCLGFHLHDDYYTHISSVLSGIYCSVLYFANFILLSIHRVPQLCFLLLYYVILKPFASLDLKFPAGETQPYFIHSHSM